MKTSKCWQCDGQGYIDKYNGRDSRPYETITCPRCQGVGEWLKKDSK